MIEVATKSFVTLILPNQSVIRMGPGKLKLTEYKAKEKTTVNLIKGALFTFVKKLFKKEKFIVKTKHASMGVRGTKFMTLANEKEAYLCVCEGKVEAENNQGQKALVSAGENIHIDNKTKSQIIKASTQMMNMGVEAFKDMGFPVKGY